jgi:hypothetical protein
MKIDTMSSSRRSERVGECEIRSASNPAFVELLAFHRVVVASRKRWKPWQVVDIRRLCQETDQVAVIFAESLGSLTESTKPRQEMPTKSGGQVVKHPSIGCRAD